jgi:hypothetical protein
VEITREMLEVQRRRHVRDLRLVKKMDEAQFTAFNSNIRSLGGRGLMMTRLEAIQILHAMIALNSQLMHKATA